MRLRHRIGRLEARHLPPAVYPICAVFTDERVLERIDMSDGSRLFGQDASTALANLPRSFPLKAYVGCDPDFVWKPDIRIHHVAGPTRA